MLVKRMVLLLQIGSCWPKQEDVGALNLVFVLYPDEDEEDEEDEKDEDGNLQRGEWSKQKEVLPMLQWRVTWLVVSHSQCAT